MYTIRHSGWCNLLILILRVLFAILIYRKIFKKFSKLNRGNLWKGPLNQMSFFPQEKVPDSPHCRATCTSSSAQHWSTGSRILGKTWIPACVSFICLCWLMTQKNVQVMAVIFTLFQKVRRSWNLKAILTRFNANKWELYMNWNRPRLPPNGRYS